MKTYEEIKEDYAKEFEYQDWERFINDQPNYKVEHHMDDICKLYSLECQKELQKRISEYSQKFTAIKSISTALKYFEESSQETIYKRDIISFLHALYQFESQGLSVVGMGYKRYDGKEITDLEGAYEGGYYTESKEKSITDEKLLVR